MYLPSPTKNCSQLNSFSADQVGFEPEHAYEIRMAPEFPSHNFAKPGLQRNSAQIRNRGAAKLAPSISLLGQLTKNTGHESSHKKMRIKITIGQGGE